jgi:hypothetical protein
VIGVIQHFCERGRNTVDVRDLRSVFPSGVDPSESDLALYEAPEAHLSAVLFIQVRKPLIMRRD